MIERIDELRSLPIVGRFYLVPVVNYPIYGRRGDWPVFGPLHTDAEIIGFPDVHRHIDYRFLSAWQRRHLTFSYRTLEVSVAGAPLCSRVQGDWRRIVPQPEPVWRRRKCWSDRHPYPHGIIEWMGELKHAYAGECWRETASGPVCPHRGARLGSLARDPDGNITCPLHGLRFDPDTGMTVTA